MFIDIKKNLADTPFPQIAAAHAAGRLLHGKLDGIGILPEGMTSGRASIALTIDTGDTVVVAETSLRMFIAAARILAATPLAVMEGIDPIAGDQEDNVKGINVE